ncbi:hypothetical protein K7432_000383 [Basidiobolus ranarum]|uniref:Lon protease homolog 2, peroxisomal n=1 Tax=Basidiobolus ranarum TaxID=34480 RepID=A0ABR2WBA8_9FUNG
MSSTQNIFHIPSVLPLIPLSNKVLLPGFILRLEITQKDNLSLMEEVIKNVEEKKDTVIIGCVPLNIPKGAAEVKTNQKENKDVQLRKFGCAARIIGLKRSLQVREGFVVVLEGLTRIEIQSVVKRTPYLEAEVLVHRDPIDVTDPAVEEAVVKLKATSRELLVLLQELKLPESMVTQLQKFINTLKPGPLADILASTVDIGFEDRLKILDMVDLKMRIEEISEMLMKQIQVLRISQKVHSTVKGNLSKKQRDYYLRQQMDAIKKELNEHDEDNDDDSDDNDLGELTKKLKKANLPEAIYKVTQREIRRLKRMQPAMGEYQVIQSYLEWLSEIPWSVSTEDIIDLKKTRQQLDDDHFGVEKVKKRIIEYLAVRKLKQDLRGPILCLIGPPGVGKTSLGQSVASALGRKFHRISLGGVSNEAEIRGHRRTYLGSMPGLIVHALRKCGVNNPVILLDEIDKLGSSTIHGDPASALLEVLDPEQNHSFTDHYLNVPIDLSKVLFIATANQNETIPAPLLDRMEVIQIPGYTLDEKLMIARRHLMPKQLKIHGLTNEQIELPEPSLAKIISEYTREAGVRNLEREIAAICRVKAVQYAEADEKKDVSAYTKEITEQSVIEILGIEKVENEVAGRTSIPGVVTGLAWTSSGSGDILFIEASQSPGKGRLHLTGKLGDVIKESAQLGLSWVKAHAYELGITSDSKSELVAHTDVHLHVPAGAVPKDGPSAGVAMVTSLVSMFTQRAIPPNLAMTGEITLRGQVLPVGGIKEKVLAAHRAGIKKVILPWRNRKDLKEIPENVQTDLEIIFVKEIRDVLKITGLMDDLMMGFISRL